MMQFFDTNVLIYAIINQIPEYRISSTRLIEASIIQETLLVSPLVLSELIFSLNKLNLETKLIEQEIDFYKNFSQFAIDTKIIEQAFTLAVENQFLKNINDAIHLKYAEKYCDELITFDQDFKKFIPHSEIKITILKNG